METLITTAVEHFNSGRLDQADALCRRVLADQPNHTGARELLARVREALGRYWAQQNQWAQAKQVMQEALELAPCWSAAWNNLSNIQRRLGEMESAELSLLRAFAYSPRDPDYLINLATLYAATNRTLPAEQCLRQVLILQPKHAQVLRLLSDLLERQGRWSEAIEIFSQWQQAEPKNAEPFVRAGILHKESEQHEAAETAWSGAIAARPEDLAGYGNLGQLYAERGDWHLAEQTYQAGLKQSLSPSLQILAATCLPVIAEEESQLTAMREKVYQNLGALADRGVKVDVTRERMPTLFYLAYHGENDRPFHERMAQLSTTHHLGKQTVAKRPGVKRIRLGILSHFLRDHTIGRLNVGLFEQLSKKKFEIIALPCQPMRDPLAQRMVQGADKTLELPGDVPSALEALRNLKLDMLFYCDIGMMPISYTLAFHRVAPVQMVTWGHPVTTGLPTMDYFLSSDALEPHGAEDCYSEKLLRLPRLTVYYDPPPPRERVVDRREFGVTAADHVYVCPQTLFKFHPRFDAVLAEILRSDERGILLLLEGRYPEWQAKLLARWQRTMPDVLSRIRFLPKLPRERFLDLLSIADVMLDPPEFGGGNTSYEGLGLGVPIVTWPDNLMRSRLTHAMYHQMGIQGLSANSGAEYARTAVALACEPARQEYYRREILAAGKALFQDRGIMNTLEDTFVECWERA
jgi:predicted O-linked N-acetylglucosamine transferase (SPINDLY family)